MRHGVIRSVLAIGLVLGWLVPSVVAQDATGDDALRARLVEVAGKVVFPERCGECHAADSDTKQPGRCETSLRRPAQSGGMHRRPE